MSGNRAALRRGCRDNGIVATWQEFETGAYRLNRSQFSPLQHTTQNDLFDALPRDRDPDPGLVRIADIAN